MIEYTLPLIISFFSSIIVIPKINKLGKRYSILDEPNNRKSHSRPIVRLGGVSIFIGLINAIVLSIILKIFSPEYSIFLKIFLLNTFLFFSIGIFEDIFNLSIKKKLTLQFLVASIVWFQGLKIEFINISFIDGIPRLELPIIVSFLITVIWIVGIVNALNWMDGLDGLLCGSSIIFCGGYLFYFFSSGNFSDLLILLFFILSSLGFLIYNFYPAKIFMGDSGSYLIGSIVAFFSIRSEIILASQSPDKISVISQLFILFIPIFDMANVILRRSIKGKSPFYPDRLHLHHRFLNLGINHKRTVLLFYIFCIVTTLIGINYMIY